MDPSRVASRALQSRFTQDYYTLEAVFKEMEKPLSDAVGAAVPHWRQPKAPSDSTVADLARTGQKMLDTLVIEFQSPRTKAMVKPYLNRIKNLRKMVTEWVQAGSGEKLKEVLIAQNTKAKNPWQKYLEYRDEALGIIRNLDVEVEGHQEIAGYTVVFHSSPRGDWGEETIGKLRWVLQEERKLLSSAGLGAFSGGEVFAYPSPVVPNSATAGGGVLAMYQRNSDLMWLSVGGEPRRVFQTLTHETGHRVYYKLMTATGRKSWEEFFEAQKGIPDVERIIAAWERFAASDQSYGRGRYLPEFMDWAQKHDRDIAMWTEMVVSALELEMVKRNSYSGAPKKGAVPELDQLIARKAEARVFLHPVTAYSATEPAELFAEVFAHYLVYGPSRIPEIVRAEFRKALPKMRMGKKKPLQLQPDYTTESEAALPRGDADPKRVASLYLTRTAEAQMGPRYARAPQRNLGVPLDFEAFKDTKSGGMAYHAILSTSKGPQGFPRYVGDRLAGASGVPICTSLFPDATTEYPTRSSASTCADTRCDLWSGRRGSPGHPPCPPSRRGS